jgi:hypothetical protein
MKKLLLFIIFILVTSAHSYTQVYGQNTDFAAGFSLLQNYPDPFENSTTIKFNLKEDCYVKLFVVNLQTEKQSLLVDGEVAAGNQGIIFNAYNKIISGNKNSTNYRCTMEVYSLTENTLIYTSDIKMLQR